MRILFVAIGEKHRASSRFRAYWWADQLAQHGHECRVLPYFRNLPPGLALRPPLDSLYRRQLIWHTVYREILAGAAWADAVVLQEVLLPKWLLTAVRHRCSRLIFDFSDPVHLLDDVIASPVLRLLHRHQSKPRFAATLAAADAAIVENDALLPLAAQHGCRAVVMRGPINTTHFQPRPATPRDTINIGWTGGVRTFAHLEPILPLLDEIGQACPQVQLTLVGAPANTGLRHIRHQVVPWRLETEPAQVADFDIGLFYLADGAWERARGGGKLLVYLAAGVPIVASSVGIGGQLVGNGRFGLLADTPSQWRDALCRLINDHALRHRFAAAARQQAIDQYSHEAYAPLMLSLLKNSDQ
ncbi:MAG: glycosyltransferase [Anaerolineales bacterium]|nr:glycosyltransferase [Anaerolineales bacterium]